MRSSGPSSGATACPRPEDLAAFCGGKLPPESQEAIGRHLGRCDRCLGAIAELARSEGSRSDERGPALQGAAPGPASEVPEAQRQIERVLQLLSDEPGPAPPASAATPGLSLPASLGEYQVVEKIGRGGMGDVYRAIHRRLKKPVAIKLLPAGRSADPRAVARFEREMEAVGRLDHPNIVRATDAGNVDGTPFLVMELVEGVDLSRLVRLRGRLAVPEACELMRQAAVGLHHAHEHGLVHRDIKPSNLIVSARGEVKILDLGLALLSQGEAPALELTLSGQVMGTADFMAPEQWQASHSVDIRADVYSLGCTLYFLLTGRPPFTGPGYDSAPRKMAAHIREPIPPIRAQREDLPAELEALLGRMTAKEPAGRPSTPGEVARALAPFCAGADLARLVGGALGEADPGATVPHEKQFTVAGGATSQDRREPARSEHVAAPRRWHRRLGYLAALGLAVVLAALALSFWPGRPGDAQPRADEERPTDAGGWQRLLARRPKPRLWVPGLYSRLDFEPDTETLWVQSAAPALIPLGETDARGYKLEVGIRQLNWVGGIGVYFGGRPGDGPDTFELQVIDLRLSQPGKDQAFSLTRSTGEIRHMAGSPRVPMVGFASTPLRRPLDNLEQLLELEVKPEGLVSVRWAGDSCRELVSKSPPAWARKGGDRGEFGIYCDASNAVISTARFLKTQ